MKTTFLGKLLAFCFVIVVMFMTIKYLATNWYLMTSWYKSVLTTSSIIIISGLIALAVGNKEITKVMLITLPIGILILGMIKAGSSRFGLDDSSLVWFKYGETMSYGLKLLWHLGLDFFVFITLLFFKYLPSLVLNFWKFVLCEE